MPCSKLMKKVHRLPNLTSMKALTNGLMTECTGFLPRIITNKRNACIWTTHLQLILWCRPCLISTKKRVKASRNFHKTFFEILKSFSVFWPATLSKKRLWYFSVNFTKFLKTTFGSSAVFLVQGQHIHQSTSLGNILAKSFVYIFLIHWWTCWPRHCWTCWPKHWWTWWTYTGEHVGRRTDEHVGQVTEEHVGQVTGEHVGQSTGKHVGQVCGEHVCSKSTIET